MKIISNLIEKRVNINKENVNEEILLFYDCRCENKKELVKYLFEQKADINIINNNYIYYYLDKYVFFLYNFNIFNIFEFELDAFDRNTI